MPFTFVTAGQLYQKTTKTERRTDKCVLTIQMETGSLGQPGYSAVLELAR